MRQGQIEKLSNKARLIRLAMDNGQLNVHALRKFLVELEALGKVPDEKKTEDSPREETHQVPAGLQQVPFSVRLR